MKRRYMIGCGFHEKPGDGKADFFHDYWIPNTWRHASDVSNVVVIADSGCTPPVRAGYYIQELLLSGDLGFHLEILDGSKPYQFPTVSAVICTLAMIAYDDECDFIYKEQDCLWFGDCVGTMYKELGDAGAICGVYSGMPVANSLFLIKHSYIPKFVSAYMGSPAENQPDQICEYKFAALEKADPANWRRFSFPYDRDRPLDMTLPVWYAQKFTPEEIEALKAAGLV